MKSYKEQVDSLIEGLMDGSVLTIFAGRPENTILDYLQGLERQSPHPASDVDPSKAFPKSQEFVSAVKAFVDEDHQKELEKSEEDGDFHDSTGSMILSFAFFVDNVAREYLKADEDKKEEMAETIFHQVLKYRVFGLIGNDPSMSKIIAQERDLLKSQLQAKQEYIVALEKEREVRKAIELPPEKKGATPYRG